VENSYPINPLSITNILTLRYDPTQKPLLPKLDWHDFVSNEVTPSVDLIEKIITNTIKKQIPKKAENVCIALSGGVDSTLVLALLKKTRPDIQIDAISVRFANSIDESKSAAKTAHHFDAKHHIIEIDNYLKELPNAISIIKSPFWDLHWYHVVKKAQGLSKHLFSGDGGDEIFGGYTFRYKKFLTLTTENSDTKEKVSAYLQCHERDHVPDQDKVFGPKCKFSWNRIYDILIPYFDNKLSRLDQVLLADYNGKLLYNFSLINTKLHEHFKIDAISPLLTNELISYVIPLSNKFKYDQKSNVGKLLLRKLLRQLDADTLTTEEKFGFNVNTINLWKSHGFNLCKHYLSNSRIVEDGWIDENWINQYIDRPDLDVRYINKFLGLLAFEIWYRLFVTKEMNKNTRLG
jgi:asparagine synthase (glutamine-hydrolysing)